MLPNVPTFAEAGYPAIVSGPWYAVVAPAGTPIEIRHKLADEIRQVLGLREVQDKLKELGVEARGLSPEEFDVYLKSEYKRWGGVIQKAGISLDK